MLRLFSRPSLLVASARSLSAAAPAPVDKNALMKLRKRTGYSYVNCRKALVEFGPDKLEDAEKWLREVAKKEGWAKAAKLSSRATTQGLVGVASSGSAAAIVELSCETDFVARGDNFKSLLQELTSSVLSHTEKQAAAANNKIGTTSFDIDSLNTPEGKSLREVVTMAVGKLGENITVARAEGLVAPTGSVLYSAAHPREGTNSVQMGKFVSVVALSRPQKEGMFPTVKLADQLCQHIIGMRSETLGEPPKEKKPEMQSSAADAKVEEDELNDFFEEKNVVIDEDETALLRQAFMLNPSQTVHDYLQTHDAVVVDFARSQLGGNKDE